MIPHGLRVREWALAGVILLAGCASLPPPREAGRPVSQALRDEIVARLQIREGQIRSLRGIAAVEVTVNQESRRFREAVALRSDGRFRLETLGALGLPTLIIASDGSRVVVHNPRDPADKLPDGCKLLNRLLGLELPPAAFVRLLAGLPPRRVVPSPFASYLPERRVYLLEGKEGDLVQRLYVERSGALQGGEVWDGRDGLRFAFAAVREVQGIPFPMSITLTHARRPVSTLVTYQAIDLNPVLADRLFSFPRSVSASDRGC
ncbi:MAG: hypothetical protein ACE5JQ_05330 [Candidatus Methylomirabilales bacterium]